MGYRKFGEPCLRHVTSGHGHQAITGTGSSGLCGGPFGGSRFSARGAGTRERAALSPVPLTPELCVGTGTVTSSFC